MQEEKHTPSEAPDQISVLRKQLMISLKFHHSEIIEKIPLEVAVQVVAEVWNSCQPEGLSESSNGTSTAIISQEQLAKAIRESKYFSG